MGFPEQDAISLLCNGWPSSKKGVANTGVDCGTPIGAAASKLAITTLATPLPAGVAKPITWFYDYGPTPWAHAVPGVPLTDPGPDFVPDPLSPLPATFVPMFLDPSHMNAQELAWAGPWAAVAGAVMSYNEPDLNGIGVLTILSTWGNLEALQTTYGVPIRIVSPSISNWSSAYATSFLAEVTLGGYRLDAIAFHFVSSVPATFAAADTQIANFKSKLDAAAAHGYPVWVTELEWVSGGGGPCVPYTAPTVQLLKYMWTAIASYCQSNPLVERFVAWPLGPEPNGGTIFSGSLADFSGALTAAGVGWGAV